MQLMEKNTNLFIYLAPHKFLKSYSSPHKKNEKKNKIEKYKLNLVCNLYTKKLKQ